MRSIRRFSVASWPTFSIFLLTLWSSGSALAAVDQIQGDCAATIKGDSLNCTSNSVELAVVNVLSIDGVPVSGGASCIAGTVIDVVVQLGLEGSGNSDAFDLGVFLALDGLRPTIPADAGGSQLCDIQTLESFPSPLTQFDAVPDICGDFDAPGGNTILNFAPELEPITMLCTPGPTGKLAFPFVVTWFRSGGNSVCTGAGDLESDTKSTCSTVDDAFEIDIEVFGGITVDKQTDPNADPMDFAFTTTGGLDAAAFILADGDSQLLGTTGALAVDPTIFTITESALPADWDITSIDCTGGASVDVDLLNQSVDIGLSIDNPVADCTFNNNKLASLTIVKNTAGGNDNFGFTGNNGIDGFSIDTTTLNQGSITFNNLAPATDYNIIELLASTPGWETTSGTCSNLSGNFIPDPDVPTISDINLRSGEHVTCTFNNVRQGTISIVKETLGGDGLFDYTTNLPGGNFSLSTGGGSSPPKAFAGVAPGSYSVTEILPGGWDLTDLNCNDPDGGTSWDVDTGIIIMDVDAGETIDCVYQNTKFGTLIVEKQTLPDGDPTIFEFTGNLAGDLTDGQQLTTTGNFVSTISSQEVVPSDWNLVDIVCSGATDSLVEIGGTSEFTPGDTSIVVLPAPGETVHCVFTNQKQSSITVVKHITGVDPLLSLDFAFASNTFPSPDDSFILSPVDPANDDQITVTDLIPGVYDVRELNNASSGWQEINSVCNDGSPVNAIDVAPGEHVICTFTNAPIGSATIIKNSIGGDGSFDFLWGTTANSNVPENSPPAFSLVTTNASQSDDFTFVMQIDEPYDLTETNMPGAVGLYGQNWNLADINCIDPTGNTTFDPGENGSDATVISDSDETVACTFLNTLDGTLVIRKQTIPDQFDQDFAFTGNPASLTGSLKDFDIAAAELTYTGQPGIAGTVETVPVGWVLTDISCTGATNSTVSIGGTNIFNAGDTDVSVDIAAGETVICTYTNTKEGSLTIVKDTDGGDGEFSFSHDVPGTASPVVINTANDDTLILSTTLLPDSYIVSETVPAEWDLTNIVCSGNTDSTITIGGAGGFDPGDSGVTVDLLSGEDIVCTFTNTMRASLALVKTVINDHGGTAVETDWILDAAGPTPLSGAGGVAATLVLPGNYSLSESAGPAGYTAGNWSCTAGNLTGSSLALGAGEVAVCTIINDDNAASLALVKSVNNDNGGTAVDTDWTLSAAGPTPLSGAGGVAATPVSAGIYNLTESAGPAGYTAGIWQCTGGILAGSNLTLTLGETAVCTIENNDVAPGLTLVKSVINDNGGTAAITDWTLNAVGPTSISGVSGSVAVTGATVDAGDYVLSESGGPAGYTASNWSCPGGSLSGSTLTVGAGETVVCTIINDDITASLGLVKTVTNDNGGTAVATDWTLSAAGPTPLSGAGGVAASSVNAGVYTLSESAGPSGYTAGTWSCTAGTLTGSSLVLGLGETAVCTIDNDDDSAGLTLNKVVLNDSGGTAVSTDWTLNAAGPTPISGVDGDISITDAVVDAGVYTLSESGGPGGYTASSWLCSGGLLSGDQLTLGSGESARCIINNDDDTAGLTLHKTVVNDNGGTAVNTDWTLNAAGPTPISGADGAASITGADVDAGVYTLSESVDPTGYTAGAWSCAGGSLSGDQLTLGSGESATCTISNDDDVAVLTLLKTVTNDNGGTAVKTDWTLAAAGPTPISGVDGDTSITAADVDAGVYTLSESGGPDGYTADSWTCVGGSLSGDQLTLGSGESARCTIINDDDAPGLTLHKTVVNDNGGTAVNTDWTLNANGPTPISGVDGDASITGADVDAGVYTLFESGGPNGYTASDWSCVGGSLSGDQLTMASGDTAVCTITNDDVEVLPIIAVPVNDKLALLLLTLMLLATGWHFRPAVVRKL